MDWNLQKGEKTNKWTVGVFNGEKIKCKRSLAIRLDQVRKSHQNNKSMS